MIVCVAASALSKAGAARSKSKSLQLHSTTCSGLQARVEVRSFFNNLNICIYRKLKSSM